MMHDDSPQERTAAWHDARWRSSGEMKRLGPASRHTRRIIRKLMEPLTFQSVLDAGCGNGTLLQSLDLSPTVDVWGVDISNQALVLAQSNRPVIFRRLDLSTMALDRQFDLVVCSEVLEHIHDDSAAAANLRRMCARDLIVSAPTGKFGADDRTNGHVRRYSASSIRRLLESSGFDIIRLVEWGFPVYTLVYRHLLNATSRKMRIGTYGVRRRAMAELLYLLLFFSFPWRGGRVFVHGRAHGD